MKLLCLLGLVSAVLAGPASQRFDGEKVFRLKPTSDRAVWFVKRLAAIAKVDLWRPDSIDQVAVNSDVDFRVGAQDIKKTQDLLEKSGLEYEVLIEDLQAMIEQQRDNKERSPTLHSYVKYNDMDTINTWMTNTVARHSNLMSLREIGTSYEGRPIHVIKIGKKTGQSKPAIFMDCGIHAREWISPAFCQWFVKEAVATYGSDPTITKVLDTMDFFVVPVINVDGYSFTWSNNRMWRKTRSKISGSNCRGVDPNRNWDAGWCTFSVGATVGKYAGDKVLRLKPENEEHLQYIRDVSHSAKVDFWKPHSVELVTTNRSVDFRVDADRALDIQAGLEKIGLKYDILIEDVQSLMEKQFDGNKMNSTGYNYEKYHRWDEINCWIAKITVENPTLISRFDIGRSYEGRHIYLLRVGKRTGHVKPAIFLDCGIHAREWISPAFCQWFVKEAVRSYGSDSAMTNLLNKLDFLVVPVINVDGYVYSWTKDRFWRKTRSRNPGSHCVGTDPNRNFDAKWCYPSAGGSDDWAYDLGIKYSFTFELRDTGKYGFLLPESQIRPTCEETMLAINYIATYVLNHPY
ncbi:hypothetical protein scyTo_0014128 [Scyliorhinus torazame]|uniref:Carboxypeptidase B n=1 Tax=Scyliorhinus torazame TaxID=75743 RepID=A0A401NH55_SCYTO|nr:hypothetical protein [Scyliorhinus torazame]